MNIMKTIQIWKKYRHKDTTEEERQKKKSLGSNSQTFTDLKNVLRGKWNKSSHLKNTQK